MYWALDFTVIVDVVVGVLPKFDGRILLLFRTSNRLLSFLWELEIACLALQPFIYCLPVAVVRWSWFVKGANLVACFVSFNWYLKRRELSSDDRFLQNEDTISKLQAPTPQKQTWLLLTACRKKEIVSRWPLTERRKVDCRKKKKSFATHRVNKQSLVSTLESILRIDSLLWD